MSVETDEEPLALPVHPVIVPDPHWPALVLDKETTRIWCELNEEWELEILSPRLPFKHNLEYEIEQDGASNLLSYRWNYHQAYYGRFETAMELGLCYRQPFLAEVQVHYYVSHTQDGPEWDCNINLDVLHITPLDPHTIAARIQDAFEPNCYPMRGRHGI